MDHFRKMAKNPAVKSSWKLFHIRPTALDQPGITVDQEVNSRIPAYFFRGRGMPAWVMEYP